MSGGDDDGDEVHDESEASSHDDASPLDDAPETNTRPKPWWQDNPEIKAIVARTQAEIYAMPQRPTALTESERRLLDEYFAPDEDENADVHAGAGSGASTGTRDEFGASSNDDASSHDDAPETNTRPKPWWQDNPEIKAIVARTQAEFSARPPLPPVDHPDPIVHDVWTGGSIRELREARDDLTRAKSRYDTAVRQARALGLSWGQIGDVLGVSRQQLHRRYRDS